MRLLALATSLALAPPTTLPAGASQTSTEHLPASATLAHLEVPLASLPVELHRRAVEFVERERERVQSPWAGARLGPHVLPMVRPGDRSATYYEIRLEDAEGGPLGYFVLSTGEHDHPVPVALEEGPPRSHQLEEALPPGQAVRRVDYFNAVSMVAEGERGQALAELGGRPVKIEAMGPSDAKLGGWSSWAQLRDGYRENYREAHEIVRRNAAGEWEDLRRAQALAEGLQPGWFREIPILERGGATLRLEGAGKEFVRLERYERGLEGDEVVSVFVQPFELNGVHPLDVHIEYGDGTSEVKHFAIAKHVPDLAAGHLAAAPTSVLASNAGADVECSKVVLRSRYDTYVYARGGGGSTLEAKGGWIGGWEVFRLEKFREDVYQLRSSGGQYVRAAYDGGPQILADVDRASGFTRFHRHNLGDGAVELRTFYGHQPLRAHFDGTVDAAVDADARKRNRMFLEYCSPTRLSSHWAGADDPTAAMRKVRKYDQLKGNQSPNSAPCASGCGATVWAMVFGWADYMAAENHPSWREFRRLYTRDGDPEQGDVTAPEFMWTNMPSYVTGSRNDPDLVAGVGNIIEEIRASMNDWGAAGCTESGSRFTAPHIMAQARQYVTRRGLQAGLTAEYDGLGIMTSTGKNRALTQIRDFDRVVAIGIDWFGHYPLAYGYEHARFAAWNAATGDWSPVTQHHRFVVNMGWGKYGSANVPFGTWFAGFLAPGGAKSGDEASSGDDKSGDEAPSKTRTGKKRVSKKRVSKKRRAKKRRAKKRRAKQQRRPSRRLPEPPNRELPSPG